MNKFLQILSAITLILLSAVLIKAWKKLDQMPLYFEEARKHILDIDTGNHKIEFKRTGSDGLRYYFSMSDTIPTYPKNIRAFFSQPDTTPTFPGYPRKNEPFENDGYSGPQDLPHISLFQGDPMHLHGVVTLENGRATGDDTIAAIIGVVDLCGLTNNVFKATPSGVDIYVRQYFDTAGGANYKFTLDGLVLRKRGDSSYTLSNDKGKNGQVLTMDEKTNRAIWQYISLNLDHLQLPQFNSVLEAKRSGLKKSDPFVLMTNINGAEVKVLSFVP